MIQLLEPAVGCWKIRCRVESLDAHSVIATTVACVIEGEIEELNRSVFLNELLQLVAGFFLKRIKELIVGHVVIKGTIPPVGHGYHFQRECVDDTQEPEVDASNRELDRVFFGVEGL